MNIIEKINKSKIIILTSILETIILIRYLEMTTNDHLIISIPICFALYFLNRNAVKRINDKSIWMICIFSFILSITVFLGRKIDYQTSPYFSPFVGIDVLYLLALFLIITAATVTLIHYINNLHFAQSKSNYKFIVFFLLILICWLPYLFIYYPGILSPDSWSSINQALGIVPLDNHQPMLFTGIVFLCIKVGALFGDISISIFCFSLVQMITMVAVFSHFLIWLQKKLVPHKYLLLSTAFFALNPVLATYSITMWKDMLFAVSMLLYTMIIFDIIESEGEILVQNSNIVKLIIYSLLVSFFRNNGFYVVIFMSISLSLIYRKKNKKFVVCILAILVFIGVIQGPIYNQLGMSESSFVESVAVPLQQIGYTVYNDGELTKEQYEYMEELIGVETIKNVYNPTASDFIKFNEAFNGDLVNNDKGTFIKNWSDIMSNNMSYYVKAYLLQSKGYWNIGTTNWIVWTDKVDNYLQVDLLGNIIGIDAEEMLDNFFQQERFILPVIGSIFNIAFITWAILFSALLLLIRKKYYYILVYVPVMLLWATLMIAAPVFCEFRYVLSLHICIPIVGFITLFNRKSSIKPEIGSEFRVETI